MKTELASAVAVRVKKKKKRMELIQSDKTIITAVVNRHSVNNFVDNDFLPTYTLTRVIQWRHNKEIGKTLKKNQRYRTCYL